VSAPVTIFASNPPPRLFLFRLPFFLISAHAASLKGRLRQLVQKSISMPDALDLNFLEQGQEMLCLDGVTPVPLQLSDKLTLAADTAFTNGNVLFNFSQLLLLPYRPAPSLGHTRELTAIGRAGHDLDQVGQIGGGAA
jgi:hypothetical protein